MRFSLLLGSLLLPQLAAAQVFKHYEVGTYVLVRPPQAPQTGGLYLRASNQLLTRDIAGKVTEFTPAQVLSFRVGGQKFVSTGGFQLRSSFGNQYVSQAFAEQLDSGQVVLLRCVAPVGDGAGPQGNGLTYGGDATATVYLLRRAPELTVTPVQANWAKGSKQLAEALRSFLAARPDLLKLLTEKRLSPAKLPSLVHALNTGAPYAD